MPHRPIFDRPIAHRGLHDRTRGIIENSLAAFSAAIEKGYAIECDVHLSRDGVPFVFHDNDLDRLTAETGPANARTIAELDAIRLTGSATNESAPRFGEFLKLVAGRTMLQVELKQQPGPGPTRMLAQRVMEELKGYRGPVTIESFDPNILIALRRLGCLIPLGIITYAYDRPEWEKALTAGQKLILRHLLHWPLTRFEFISCLEESLELPAVRLFRSFGLPVTTWTIKSPAQALASVGRADQIVFEGFYPPIA
jgi:glycerophosphoryl diester phosphodiesterase